MDVIGRRGQSAFARGGFLAGGLRIRFVVGERLDRLRPRASLIDSVTFVVPPPSPAGWTWSAWDASRLLPGEPLPPERFAMDSRSTVVNSPSSFELWWRSSSRLRGLRGIPRKVAVTAQVLHGAAAAPVTLCDKPSAHSRRMIRLDSEFSAWDAGNPPCYLCSSACALSDEVVVASMCEGIRLSH
jgi:hypothetical protein